MDEIIEKNLAMYKSSNMDQERTIDFIMQFSDFCVKRFGGTSYYWKNAIVEMIEKQHEQDKQD